MDRLFGKNKRSYLPIGDSDIIREDTIYMENVSGTIRFAVQNTEEEFCEIDKVCYLYDDQYNIPCAKVIGQNIYIMNRNFYNEDIKICMKKNGPWKLVAVKLL